MHTVGMKSMGLFILGQFCPNTEWNFKKLQTILELLTRMHQIVCVLHTNFLHFWNMRSLVWISLPNKSICQYFLHGSRVYDILNMPKSQMCTT